MHCNYHQLEIAGRIEKFVADIEKANGLQFAFDFAGRARCPHRAAAGSARPP